MTSTDILLVGAGPIGIEMAVALKRAGMDYIHVDASQIGATIAWFCPQTRFFSSNDRIAIAGVPLQTPDENKATREQYLAYLRSVVQLFDLPIQTYCPVTNIEKHDGRFVVTCSPPGRTVQYSCKRLILATGGTAHARKLDVPGEDLPHVSSRFDDPHAYFRKRLLVVGGKNSAIESALRAHHAGATVSLSYRREQLSSQSVKYWLYPEITGLLKTNAIAGHFSSTVRRITPTHATLDDPSGTRDIEADFVLTMIGYVADMTLCRLAGVRLSGECQKPDYDPFTMQANVPNVYLAGTVTGGTQDKYTVFIENGHVHVDRILAALQGRPASAPDPGYDRPES